MLINKNDIQKVMFQGVEMDALHFGAALIWSKNQLYTFKGKFYRNAPSADRWVCYNGEKHYFDREFEIEIEKLYFDGKPSSIIVSEYIEYIEFPPLTVTAKSITNMFNGCERLTNLDVSGFDTSGVTEMGYGTKGAFYGCSALTSLDLSNWNTHNVTDMSEMFSDCSALTSLNISGFDTSNVKKFDGMFSSCSSLESIDVSHFNTSKATSITCIFYECSSLKSIDVSNFNTQQVKSMYGVFQGCNALTEIDITNWNTENVQNFNWMFTSCKSLTSLDLSYMNTINATDISYMFYNCIALQSLNIDEWDLRKVTKTDSAFKYCDSLTTVTGEIEGLDVNIEFRDCPLTRESALVFINGLKQKGYAEKSTITFSKTTYPSLTEEDIAIATSKGWTVTQADPNR